MIALGDTLACLGSRLAIVFDPVEHRVLLPRYGRFDEIVADLAIGIRHPSGKSYALPFTRKYKHFEFVEQLNTMNSITYQAYAPDLGLKLIVQITSPFYPQDEEVSTAPLIFIDFTVERLSRYRWQPPADEEPVGEIFVEFRSRQIRVKQEGAHVRLSFKSTPVENREAPGKAKGQPRKSFRCRDLLLPHSGGLPLRIVSTQRGFASPFDLRQHAKSEPVQLTWCAFTSDRVLEIFGERHPFKYIEFFADEEELVRYAILERFEILRKSAFFDRQFQRTRLGKAQEDLIAFSFHSFLLNSWWTLWQKDRDWFSVWEGSCYYHSTIDVEYNDALFYFACWPQLLERLLRQWALFEIPGEKCLGGRGKGTAYLAHDMGSGGRVGEQHYHHPMEVEETTNYILLAHAHWRWTGRDDVVHAQYKLLKRLAKFLLKADTTGNGVPDVGVANTIDDATPALQFGREQVYLGFKALAALEKAAEVAGAQNDGRFATTLRKQAATLLQTIEEKGWVVDHYAVTLSPKSRGMVDAWTGKAVGDKELEGWDAYSIYTSNGLLYPYLVGAPVDIRTGRVRRDMLHTIDHTQSEYGCTHTSSCDNRLWISQNLWRDFMAAYLDVNLLYHANRYWAYQIVAGTNRPITCYYDTVGNNLCFYPRGITSIGAFFAACRFQLDRVEGWCCVDPLLDHLDLPLLALARWDKRQVPRLTVWRENGVRHVKVSYRNCLRGLEFVIDEYD